MTIVLYAVPVPRLAYIDSSTASGAAVTRMARGPTSKAQCSCLGRAILRPPSKLGPAGA
jgi:hypothetical protein